MIQLIHDVVTGHGRQRVGGKVVRCLPTTAILKVPRRIIQHWWLGVTVSGLVCEEGFGGMVARGGKVLNRTLRGVPGRNGDEGVVLVGRKIRYPCRILGHMKSFLLLASGCGDIGYVEYTVGVLVAVDAFGGQGLDVVEDAILERDGIVERDELVVIVVDLQGIWEVDGKDANPLGSCGTVSTVCQWAANVSDVHMFGVSVCVLQRALDEGYTEAARMGRLQFIAGSVVAERAQVASYTKWQRW